MGKLGKGSPCEVIRRPSPWGMNAGKQHKPLVGKIAYANSRVVRKLIAMACGSVQTNTTLADPATLATGAASFTRSSAIRSFLGLPPLLGVSPATP